MTDKLALAGVVQGPVTGFVTWLVAMTPALQAVLLIASIFSALAAGIYYLVKAFKDDESDD